MTIEVRLFADLARYLPPGARGGTSRLDVPEGATVDDVRGCLGIPADFPGLFLVNGLEVAAEHRVSPGDTLDIIPPLSGG